MWSHRQINTLTHVEKHHIPRSFWRNVLYFSELFRVISIPREDAWTPVTTHYRQVCFLTWHEWRRNTDPITCLWKQVLKWAIIWIWQPAVNALFWQFFYSFLLKYCSVFSTPLVLRNILFLKERFAVFFEVAAFSIIKRVAVRGCEKFAQFVLWLLRKIFSLKKLLKQQISFQLSSLKYKFPKLIFMIVTKILRHIKTIFVKTSSISLFSSPVM